MFTVTKQFRICMHGLDLYGIYYYYTLIYVDIVMYLHECR